MYNTLYKADYFLPAKTPRKAPFYMLWQKGEKREKCHNI